MFDFFCKLVRIDRFTNQIYFKLSNNFFEGHPKPDQCAPSKF